MHCRRTNRCGWLRTSLALRSGALIFRTLWRKIIFDRQLANLGIQLLDLPRRLSVHLLAHLRIKRPRRLLLQLLLPAVNLVGVNLIALREVGYSRLLPQRFQRDLRLQLRIDLASRLFHPPLRLPRQNGRRST